MQIDPRRDVIIIGQGLPYEDGVELSILEILESVRDRSSTSDELASHITDWPTRYHFSRLRRNLFEPLRIQPSMRVLEIGCGMGANLVTLAETGAEVVGVEGSLTRARAARVRTRAHDNVTVYAGDVSELPGLEPFDVIVVVGVLEYSPTAAGGAAGPMAMLEGARSLMRSDGVLVLAIENQVGLKYLLSYPEDHLSIPWIGLEGYPDESSPRTWSKSVLAGMLQRVGLIDQEWLYPYPDYKLPTFIARDRLFRSAPGRQVLRQFVRNPVGSHAGVGKVACDEHRAFGVMLDAEVGPDTANSFLIVASAEGGRSDQFVRDADAWMSSGERLQMFRNQRVIQAEDEGYVVASTSGPTDERQSEIGWLRNVGNGVRTVRLGECMQDCVLQAVHADDMGRLADVLREYDGFLASSREPSDSGARHPFFIDASRPNLPADFLDSTLKNLIRDASSELHYVDREWVVAGGVDEELVRVRAYVELSVEIARSGVRNRWSPLMTVGDLALTLRCLVSDGWSDDVVVRYACAEDELQRIVNGQSVEGAADRVLRKRLLDFIPSFPVLSMIRRLQGDEEVRGALLSLRQQHDQLQHDNQQLQHDNQQLQHDNQQLQHDNQQLQHDNQQLQHDNQSLVLRSGELETDLDHVRLERDELRRLLDGADHARQSLANEVDALRRSRAYRLGRVVTAPLSAFR